MSTGFYVHRSCSSCLDELKGQASTRSTGIIVGLQHLFPIELVLVSKVLHIVEHLVVNITVAVKAPDGEVGEGEGKGMRRLTVVFHLVPIDIPVYQKSCVRKFWQSRISEKEYSSSILINCVNFPHERPADATQAAAAREEEEEEEEGGGQAKPVLIVHQPSCLLANFHAFRLQGLFQNLGSVALPIANSLNIKPAVFDRKPNSLRSGFKIISNGERRTRYMFELSILSTCCSG